MADDSWRNLDDEGLERLLIERWLVRGATIAVMLLAAIAATWIGVREREGATLADYVTVGTLGAIALAAAVVGFTMRQVDLRIHREVRRRRAGGDAKRLP